jgi:hypothetical protein
VSHDLTTTTEPITWERLVAAEPRLAALEAAVRAERDDGDRYCANAVWHNTYDREDFKAEFARLVGWGRNADLIDAVTGRQEFTVGSVGDLLDEMSHWEPYRDLAKAIDAAAGRGFLWTDEAYEVGYDHLYALLPDCRGCICIAVR